MATLTTEQKTLEKTIQRENKTLRIDIKQLQQRLKQMQTDLTVTNRQRDRLEALCRELQKQNKFIRVESNSKIQEANDKGKELANEVYNNMGFMKNINENLSAITAESLQVKKENENLAAKIGILKSHYEEREKILQDALNETNDSLVLTRTENSELKYHSAQEKEKILREMQQLADALIKSREQIKEAKTTEIDLRKNIQNYDEKFNGLQHALSQTNNAYGDFKKEMEKVTWRTKQLEKDTQTWQKRWEETNAALLLLEKSHVKIKSELGKSHESLTTMTNLCRTLQSERKELLLKIKPGDVTNMIIIPSALPNSSETSDEQQPNPQ